VSLFKKGSKKMGYTLRNSDCPYQAGLKSVKFVLQLGTSELGWSASESITATFCWCLVSVVLLMERLYLGKGTCVLVNVVCNHVAPMSTLISQGLQRTMALPGSGCGPISDEVDAGCSLLRFIVGQACPAHATMPHFSHY